MSHTSAPPGSSSHHSPSHVGVSNINTTSLQNNHPPPPVTDHRLGQPTLAATGLPRLATLTASANPSSSSADSPTTRRSTGLHNILNPTEHSSSQHVVRPLQPQDARPPHGESPQAPRLFASPRGRKRGESHSPGLESDTRPSARAARRILTPRSPGLRAASLGAHRSPSIGSSYGSRASLHGPDGRRYTAEPGTHGDAMVPPMPPLPVTRSVLPAIQTSEQENHERRRASINTSTPLMSNAMQPPYMNAGGNGAGPASGIVLQPPPSPSFPPTPQPGPTMNTDGTGTYTGYHGSTMGQGMPRVQSGWKMALETEQGREVVDINIDYQQASKMADEKRKRNAGASARFRARRKEKEKESSQMISGLQQELHEMTEERDFYLNERNFYRDLLSRSNTGQLPPRPQSPNARHGRVMNTPATDGSPSHPYGSREGPETNAQRRRTGDYPPSFSTSPSSSTYNPAYPPPTQPYNHPNSAPPPPYPTDVRAQHHHHPPPPPGVHPPPHPTLAPARPQEMDPYRRDMDRWSATKP